MSPSTKRSFAPAELARSPEGRVLGFPGAPAALLRARARQLESLGVGRLELRGPTLLGRARVLGKGHAGVVIAGSMGGKRVAVKARRTDSSRPGMAREARLLAAANEAGAGPALLAHSKNFLVMELLGGAPISEWARAAGARDKKKVFRKVLEDCHRLDMAGIDHGELHRISRHVMVGREAVLLDFESASTRRRAANVTSAGQALFVGTAMAGGRQAPREGIIGALRAYKAAPGRASFDALLSVLRL